MAEPQSGYDVLGFVTNVLSLFVFIGTLVGRCRPTSQLLVLEDSWKRVEAALNSSTEETVVLNDELVRQIDRLRSRSDHLKQQVSNANTIPAIVIEVMKGLTCRILVVNSKVRHVYAHITALQAQARYGPRRPAHFEGHGMFQTLLGLRRRGESVQPPLTSLSAMTNVPVYAGASMPFPAWPFATTVPADTICFTPSEEPTRSTATSGASTSARARYSSRIPRLLKPRRDRRTNLQDNSLLPLPVTSRR